MIGSKIYVVFREAQLLGLNFYASKIRVSTYQLPHTTSFSPTLVSRSNLTRTTTTHHPTLPPLCHVPLLLPYSPKSRSSFSFPSFRVRFWQEAQISLPLWSHAQRGTWCTHTHCAPLCVQCTSACPPYPPKIYTCTEIDPTPFFHSNSEPRATGDWWVILTSHWSPVTVCR